MAYNNYNTYPMAYSQMPNAAYGYNTVPQQMSYAQPVQPQNSIIWVQGEAGAKAYPVVAGTNVLLMDSESECFYIKSTDASGMPLPLRIFEYKEVVRTQPTMQSSQRALPDNSYDNMDDYAKKEDVEQLRQQIDDLKSNTYRYYRGEGGRDAE